MLTTLTKSRFKLGLECVAKVYYDANRQHYENLSVHHEMLEWLAFGGHKVGALAKMMFRRADPSAVEVTARGEADQIAETAQLLSQDNVTIFEGTIKYHNLLLRADVLRKRGSVLDLIEVKSIGWDKEKDSLVGQTARSNPLDPTFEEYVYDLAFQDYVLSKRYPEWEIRPWLLLLDEACEVELENLWQAFEEREQDGVTSMEPRKEVDWSKLTVFPLIQVDAKQAVVIAQSTSRPRRGRAPLVFAEAVERFSDSLAKGIRLHPTLSAQCKSCQFYADPTSTSIKTSGWHECMREYVGGDVPISRPASIFGLYGQVAYDQLLQSGVVEMAKVPNPETPLKMEGGEIALRLRQQLQLAEAKHKTTKIICDPGFVRDIAAHWQYPLHFIDFETTRTALPYFQGHRPNQQVLFQFSHHTVTAGGAVAHTTECLIADPGCNPSFEVLRALQQALSKDCGTVFHWYPHERTVLAAIGEELRRAASSDCTQLLNFLDQLGLHADSHGRFFDLGRFFEQYVFVPGSGGSSSIKKLLPALLQHSEFLKATYRTPDYGTVTMPSHNFIKTAWYHESDGVAVNPYCQLGQRFQEDWLNSALESAERNEGERQGGDVADGTAAMIAFDRLQSPTLTPTSRAHLRSQLKRYCELDTLAMVMAYQSVKALL